MTEDNLNGLIWASALTIVVCILMFTIYSSSMRDKDLDEIRVKEGLCYVYEYEHWSWKKCEGVNNDNTTKD